LLRRLLHAPVEVPASYQSLLPACGQPAEKMVDLRAAVGVPDSFGCDAEPISGSSSRAC
jgi:hypothetical protein